jgi:hypothetical protein
MQKFRKQKQSSANSIGTMESRDHSKNGVSPKDLKGVGKIFCICLLFGCIIVQSANAQAISLFKTVESLRIENSYTYNKYLPMIAKAYRNDNDNIYKYELTILDDELSPLRSFTINFAASTFLAEIRKDYDAEGIFYDYASFTQTFFNDDEKIEYISYEAEGEFGSIRQLKIMSEDGATLGVIPSPIDKLTIEGGYLHAITLGNNKYLLWKVDYIINDNGHQYFDKTYYVYKITTTGNNSISIQKVPSDILAFPNPVKQQEPVTITLGNLELSTGSSVQIADMSGRVIEQKAIAPNEKELRLSTRRWLPGQYIYTVISNNKAIDSGKIIVR